jgi:ribosome-associated protein
MNKALAVALKAIDDKKAQDVVILDISEVSSFTDFFVICSGSSSRQVQAITDAIQEKTTAIGHKRTHLEGYANAEWVLLDFMDFVVHVFSPTARAYYDLERLWRDGKRVDPESLTRATRQPRARSAKAAAPARKARAATTPKPKSRKPKTSKAAEV